MKELRYGDSTDSIIPGQIYMLILDDRSIPVKVQYQRLVAMEECKRCPLGNTDCYEWLGPKYCCIPLEEVVE